MPSVKIEKSVWERVRRCATIAGYSGPEEFVAHLIEKELAKLEDSESDEEVFKKLKGLGYIE